jgi:ankyrin repeat protein
MKKIYVIAGLLILSLNAFAQNYSQMPRWMLEEKLAQAVFMGEEKTAEDLLNFGVSVNSRDKFNQPLTLLSAYPYYKKPWDSTKIFDMLIAKGADINAKNDFGTTYFMYQCRSRCNIFEEDKILYERRGIDINVRDIFGGSIYDYEYFGTGEKFPNFAPPEEQIKIDENTVVWRLTLEQGLARLGDYGIYEKYKNTATIAMALAYYHQYDLLREIPSQKFNRERDKNGDTVLFYAAQTGCDRCLFGFENEKGFFDLKNNAGETALIHAAQFGQDYFVLKLLEKRANPNIADKNGKTALFYAAEYDYFQTVLNLLIGNADANIALPDGTTPLISAAKRGNVKAVTAFIFAKKFAEEARKKDSKSEADLKMLETLEKIDLDKQNTEGKTALMIAAENVYKDIVGILLKVGASKTLKDKKGKTALDYAKKSGHKEIIKILSER